MTYCAICGSDIDLYEYDDGVFVCLEGDCGRTMQREEIQQAREEREQAHEELDRMMGWD